MTEETFGIDSIDSMPRGGPEAAASWLGPRLQNNRLGYVTRRRRPSEALGWSAFLTAVN
jgi:hypothetical protein